jgi:hypothetical protein
MARIRTIKPEFWTDEDLCSISEASHMFAAALLNQADDEGYFNANPLLLKSQIYPLRDPSLNIQCMLTELSNIGYLEVYDSIGRKVYGKILNFLKHQKVNRPSPSKIKPLLGEKTNSLNTHGMLNESSPLEQGTGNREQGGGRENFSPSQEEIKKFAEEEKLTCVKIEKFFLHYEATGWELAGKKIKDWKALLRKWDLDDREKQTKEEAKQGPKIVDTRNVTEEKKLEILYGRAKEISLGIGHFLTSQAIKELEDYERINGKIDLSKSMEEFCKIASETPKQNAA